MEKHDLSNHLSDAFKQPVKVEQFASSVPTEAKVLVRESEHQFTRHDVNRTIDRKMRTGVHWLNPPLTDGLNSVGAIYKALADAAFNYQQEHITSYYEMFPRLTNKVLTADELANADSTWLRLHYREISSRVAHRVWHYMQAATMLSASLVNMINLGRYEGSEVSFKTIASTFRASRINTMTPNYNKFPKPNGVEDYLVSNGLYLAGQANDGTPIVSIPLYTSDIFGNRGWHHIPGSTFVSLDGKDMLYADVSPTSQGESNDFIELQANVARAIIQYGRGAAEFDFRLPQVENMGVTFIQDHDNLASSVRSGGGGSLRSPYGNWGDGSYFSNAILRNYHSWANYITKYFGDFADVTSDWYRLVTNQLSICSESKTTASLISAIRGMKYATVEDYLRQSRFGASNKATCATIVKYMPYDMPSDNSEDSETFITNNFDRYHFYRDNMREVIRESLRFPKLTPSVFQSNQGDNGIDTVYVGNTGPNYLPVDQMANIDEPMTGTSPLVYGQRAYYDLARAVSIDVEVDQIVTIGLSKDASLAIAERDTTSKVYDELRSALFVDVLPLIDDTDPYVCGLNYFFAADSALKSQTEITLMDANNARNVDDLEKSTVDTARNIPKANDAAFNFGSVDIHPLSEAYGDDLNANVDTPVAAAHICNEDYFNHIKHAIAFGGVGICDDVINGALVQNAGSEFKRYNIGFLAGSVYKDWFNDLTVTSGPEDINVFAGAFLADSTPRHSGEAINSVGSFLAIAKALVGNDPSEMVAEITLPFTYGSVPINANPSPLRGFKAISSLIPMDTMAGQTLRVPAVRVFQTGYCRKTAQNVYSKDLDYMSQVDGYDIALEKSIYGISHYDKEMVNTDGYVDINIGAFSSPTFATLLDGKLRLMGTSFVKAMGERNTVAFWDKDHAAVAVLSESGLNATIDFKRNDTVAEVTVKQNQRDARGFNGTSSKQGDSPKFISPNRGGNSSMEDNGRGKPRKQGRKRFNSDFKRGRTRDVKVTPEKSTGNPTKGRTDADSSEKPFLDSVSGFANGNQKKSVSTSIEYGTKPSVIEAM